LAPSFNFPSKASSEPFLPAHTPTTVIFAPATARPSIVSSRPRTGTSSGTKVSTFDALSAGGLLDGTFSSWIVAAN
jgi:hypothetical protein